MNKNILYFTLLLILSISCQKEEYDLRQTIDLTMNVGGDSLAIPIGSTDTLFAGNFIKLEEIPFLQVGEDGRYYASMEEDFTIHLPFSINSEDLKIDNFSVSQTFDLNLSPSAAAKSLTANIEESTLLEFEIDDIPTELIQIDQLLLNEGAELVFSVSFEGLPETGGAPIEVSLATTFPDVISLTGEGVSNNTITINDTLSNSSSETTASLLAIEPSPEDLQNSHLSVKEVITFNGTITLPTPSLPVSNFNPTENARMQINLQLRNMSPKKLYGTIYANETVTHTLAIGDIPPILQDDKVVLDFHNPQFLANVSTNFGIPYNFLTKFTPYIGGYPQTNSVQDIYFRVPGADEGTTESFQFYAAATQDDLPPGAEYSYANFSQLFQQIPDSIHFDIQFASQTNNQHVFDFETDYFSSFNCLFTLPVSFGANAYFEFSDTIADISPTISTLLNDNQVILFGEVANKLPFDLDLELIALDANNQAIPTEPIQFHIASMEANEQAVTTPLDIKIATNNSSSTPQEIRSFKVKFVGTTGSNAEGLSIKEDSYVTMRLKAKLLGGITVDIDEL